MIYNYLSVCYPFVVGYVANIQVVSFFDYFFYDSLKFLIDKNHTFILSFFFIRRIYCFYSLFILYF